MTTNEPPMLPPPAPTTPKKPKTHKASQTGFLFVNKDASSGSLSRSAAKEKAIINRHVQAGRRHLRQERLELGPAGRPRFGFAFRRKGESELEQSPQSEESLESPSPSLNSEAEPRSPWFGLETGQEGSPATELSSEDRELSVGRRMAEKQQERLITMICQQSTPVDPFDMQSIKLDPQVCSLLRYYLDASRPAKWQIESGQPNLRTEAIQQRSRMLIRECLDNEMTMNTTLAAMAGLRINQEGVPLQHYVTLYIHDAIVATRKYLGTRPVVDARLIMNIFHLSCAEWFAFKSDASLVHLKLVKVLVDQAGGWKKLNAHVMEVVLLGDGMFAAEKLTLPVFPCDFDPGRDGEIVAWMSANRSRNELGQGLAGTAQAEIVPDKLLDVIEDLADCVSVMQAHSELPNAPPETRHWLNLRNLALRHRLLTMTTVDPRTYALRVALMMWIILVLFVSGRKLVVQIMAPKLQTIVRGIERRRWRGQEAVLLWIMSVGAISAASESACHAEFVREVAALVHDLYGDLGGEEVLEDGLVQFSRRFFYVAKVQQPMLQRLARSINAATARG